MRKWRAQIALTVTFASSGCGLLLGLEDHGLDDGSDAATEASSDLGTVVDAGPPDRAPPPPVLGVNRIFVTSTVLPNAAFGGVAVADILCQAHALDAGLDGSFVALMSSSNGGAGSRLEGARGWVRVDGREVADTAAQLLNGDIWYPVAVDEHGNTPSSTSYVATGATRDGGIGLTCNDWNGADGGSYTCGYWPDGYTTYLAGGTCTCAVSARLYCLETNKNVPVNAPPRAQGRLAFVSKSSLLGDAGLPAADTLCQTEATAAGLTGTFKALLATSTAAAASRFDASAGAPTWIRGDGIPLFSSAADLPTNKILIPIVASADSTKQGGAFVWTGAVSPADLGPTTSCGDWTGAGAGYATSGSAGSVRSRYSGAPGWFGNYSVLPCNFQNRVYCFQE
jgi:hypothetical protein